MSGYNPRIEDDVREKILDRIINTRDWYTSIAKEFGVSKDFVAKLARENGFRRNRSRPRKPMSTQTEQAIADEFLKDDLTSEQIGDKYNRSKRTVTLIAKRLRPEIDLMARGRRMASRTRFGEPKRSRYEERRVQQNRDLRRALSECPREQKIEESRKAIAGPGSDRYIGARFEWETISQILEARYEAGEEELAGSFDKASLRLDHRRAMEKLRTALEQYEYADDTPNRSGEHLRANIG